MKLQNMAGMYGRTARATSPKMMGIRVRKWTGADGSERTAKRPEVGRDPLAQQRDRDTDLHSGIHHRHFIG
jgi:hypothetical protein